MVRKILGLLAIFVLFYLGAHFYLRWRNTVTDDVTKIGRLVECQPNDVRAITIEQLTDGRAQPLSFERYDQPAVGVPAVAAVARWQWRMKAPISGEADATVLRRVASTLCELYDPTPVREEEFRPETAGAHRARKVEVTLAGEGPDSNLLIEFGALQDSTTVIRYRRGSRARTVRIPAHFLEAVSLPVEEFRNRKVMRADADNVQQLTLALNGKERFTLERSGADWQLRAANKALGNGSEEAGKFVNRITTLRAIVIEGEGFSPADCAALKANAALTVRDITGKDETVRFVYGPGTPITACSSQGTQKFQVHRDFLPFLDVPAKSLLVPTK